MNSGPVFPVPVAFQQDGSLDLPATERYLGYLHQHGAQTVMTTAGTSLFNFLSEFEIGEFNSVVAGFPGVSILGDVPVHERPVLLRYPDRHYSDDTLWEWFEHQAAEQQVYIHVAPLRDGRAPVGGSATFDFTTGSLMRLAEHPNIIGIKEECADMETARLITKLMPDDFHVIAAGGSMWRADQTGAKSWLAGVGSLWPEHEITPSYTTENAAFGLASRMGWHRFMRSALTILDLLPDHIRQPWCRITEEEETWVHEFIEEYKP